MDIKTLFAEINKKLAEKGKPEIGIDDFITELTMMQIRKKVRIENGDVSITGKET